VAQRGCPAPLFAVLRYACVKRDLVKR
jgi:hypothetical protein